MIGRSNLPRDSSDQIADGIGAVIRSYLVQCPNARLLLLGLLPQGSAMDDPIRIKIADINRQISMLENDRVHVMDLSAKYLHPEGTLNDYLINERGDLTGPGYQVLTDCLEPVIQKNFPTAIREHPSLFATTPPPPAPSAESLAAATK